MNRLKELLPQLIVLVIRGIGMFQACNMAVFSAYATLFIGTSVIPFIILIISVVNLLPGYSAEDIVEILLQVLPDLKLIRKLVELLVTDLKAQSGGLLASLAAVTALWSASKGVMAIQKGINQLDRRDTGYEIPAEENSELVAKGIDYGKGVLKRLAFTLVLIILIPAVLVFEMLGDSIAEAISSAIKKIDPDVQDTTLKNIASFFQASSLVVILLAFLVILCLYAILPAVRRTLRSQIPGALAAGVCCFAFTKLFSFFIPRFYHASNVYGTLAALFLLVMWLRYVVIIIFAGSVLNRTLEEKHRKESIKLSEKNNGI